MIHFSFSLLSPALGSFANDEDDPATGSLAAVVVLVVGLLSTTSTTRTTALPSSTLRTLSASHCRFAPAAAVFEPNDEAEEVEPPEKASQNALPSFPNKVWLASAAYIASLCTSFSFSLSAARPANPAANDLCRAGGELGGVGYDEAGDDDDEEERTEDLPDNNDPDKPCASLKNWGRKPDARPDS